MIQRDKYFHQLMTHHSLDGVKLNNPFEYRPSEVILEAQHLLMSHIQTLENEDDEVRRELDLGKMFGVMVVRNKLGEMGYLAAFSGCMAGRVEYDVFLPPIFGRGEQNEEFEAEDRRIGEMGCKIEALESSAEYCESQELYEKLQVVVFQKIAELDSQYAASKTERDKLRKESQDPQIIERLQRESQDQKGRIRREVHQLKGELKSAKTEAMRWREELAQLREKRREMSNELQRKMFKSYFVVNGRGEQKSLFEIFDELLHRLPPSGAGECAAPKLLYYALVNDLTPIALGEFWYGRSSQGEVRHHGDFYGACRSRCYPILSYMLQGLEVADVEPELIREASDPLLVLFEDQHLVVFDKPAGLLSVPGRSSAPSVKSIVEERYPEASGSLIVHRLDQDTSGVLVVAKSAEVHKALQRQFGERKLSKRYVAVVEGVVASDKGEITLPIIPNLEDRPRQMVDYERGKKSLTTYEVIERGADFTRLALSPHTGRTHQLRLHCAHQEGLNAPIKGDRLYGDGSTRLHLHAERITFTHPITGEELTVISKLPF